jgi:hypothetical protein
MVWTGKDRAAFRMTSALSVFQNVYTLTAQIDTENSPLQIIQLVTEVIAVY